MDVIADPACNWNAVSNDSWILITSGSTGIGNGSVSFNVEANAGGSRSGTITIAGMTFTIKQAPCVPTDVSNLYPNWPTTTSVLDLINALNASQP